MSCQQITFGKRIRFILRLALLLHGRWVTDIRTVCNVMEPVAVTDNTVSQAPVTMALKPESENNINIVTNLTTPTAAVTVEHRFSN